jgi:hypothetical protein
MGRMHGLLNSSIPTGDAQLVSYTDLKQVTPLPWPPHVEPAAPLPRHTFDVKSTSEVYTEENIGRTTTATFITPQTLVAFPFASGLVAAMWRGSGMLVPRFASSPWTGLVIALFVGFVVYGVTVTDRRVKLDRGKKVVGIGIALINCFYLFLAAAGLDEVVPHALGR